MQTLEQRIGATELPTLKDRAFIIDYRLGADPPRLVTCQAHISKGPHSYLGAVCSMRNSYREFRTDRIGAVSDPHSGEVLGDGGYFAAFRFDKVRAKRPDWGLPSARVWRLSTALKVLAFMARCDGRWDDREDRPIALFVDRYWCAKEWTGTPPTDEIMTYAKELQPSADEFFSALRAHNNSSTSLDLLLRAVREVVEADGVIVRDEFDWCVAMEDHLEELALAELAEAEAAGAVIRIGFR